MALKTFNRLIAGLTPSKTVLKLAQKKPKFVRRAMLRIGMGNLPTLKKAQRLQPISARDNLKHSGLRIRTAKVVKRARRMFGKSTVRNKIIEKSWTRYKRFRIGMQRTTGIPMATVKRANDTGEFVAGQFAARNPGGYARARMFEEALRRTHRRNTMRYRRRTR